MKKLIISSIVMAIGFLSIVLVYTELKNVFVEANTPADTAYSTKQLIMGGLAETIRAFLTTWLYRYHKTDKSRITNALKFGLLCSALIASIWLFIGVGLIDSADKLSFIIDDGIILGLQALISGIVLWLFYKKE